MSEALADARVQRILRLPEEEEAVWQAELERFRAADVTLTRKTASEASIRAVQDFHVAARYYNGSGHAKHHYHESLENWFREFRRLAEV
jgi:hypothetical protein